jgi:hypothetical protein
MATPTPAIPTFTDGLIVHATDLNALGSNLTNLYNYGQAGFRSQRPCVIAQQTTGQAIANATDTIVNFQSAAVNTDNMWTASVANQVTIQHAGIYLIFAQARFPALGSPTLNTFVACNIMANGTAVGNTIAANNLPFTGPLGSGPANQCSTIANLAAGATLFVDVYQTSGSTQTMQTTFGGSYLGAIFLTPSS